MRLLFYYARTSSKRLTRFFWFVMLRKNRTRPLWVLEWLLLLLDIVAVPEILQLLHRIIIWDQQKLTSREKEVAFDIFRNTLEWDLIRMNKGSLICRKYRFAFVSFHTIHCGDVISDGLIIHELMHVWQYQKYGSAYIVRALHAQHTEGYDYGGISALASNKDLTDFNFEQMAEIIKDGYLARGESVIHNKYIQQLFD